MRRHWSDRFQWPYWPYRWGTWQVGVYGAAGVIVGFLLGHFVGGC